MDIAAFMLYWTKKDSKGFRMASKSFKKGLKRLYKVHQMDIDELNSIDCGKILACLRSLRPLVNQADEVLREQDFMLYVPYNAVVQSNTTDKVLVQGIIDLVLIKGNEATLIDYKLTNIRDPKKLAQKYALQLKCYTMAIQNSKGVTVTKKILYSFLQEMQIIV